MNDGLIGKQWRDRDAWGPQRFFPTNNAKNIVSSKALKDLISLSPYKVWFLYNRLCLKADYMETQFDAIQTFLATETTRSSR